MRNLTDPRWITFKGLLFLFQGLLSAALLILQFPNWRVVVLLALAIWSFCRAYYFAFYVIEHYVDPGFRFSGLWAFARYMATKKSDPPP
jgi:hypothetical protein